MAIFIEACKKKSFVEKMWPYEDVKVMKEIVVHEGEVCPEDMVFVPEGEFCMDVFEYPNTSGEMPIHNVSFDDAAKLCAYEGKRLPTVKEWRMACQVTDKTLFFYGNKYDKDKCWTDKPFSAGPVACGSMPGCTNERGLNDMSGNVWEWVDGKVAENGDRLMIGGAWVSWPDMTRCDFVASAPDGEKHDTYGFRCAYEP